MLCRPNCQIYRLGSQSIIRPDDCLCLIEVKGNARGKDIRAFDDRIQMIRNMDAQTYPVFGVFCYAVQLQEKTILKRFGLNIDEDTLTIYNDDTLSIQYPNIDFFICLDEDKKMFLRRSNSGRFIRLPEPPVIMNVFNLFQSLIFTATNQQA